MKKRVLSGLLLLLVLLLTAVPLAYAESASADTMRLEKTEGSVTVQNMNGVLVKPTEKMRLFNGYTVATAEDSYAWLMLDDSKACKLDKASSVRIEKDGRHLKLTLERGGLFFNVTEKLASDESMQIRTGTMVTGIRGTSGWCRIRSSGWTEFALLDGRAEITALYSNGTPREYSTIEIWGGRYAESAKGFGALDTARDVVLLRGGISFRDVPSFVAKELQGDARLRARIGAAGTVSVEDVINNITTKEQEERSGDDGHVHAFGSPNYVWTENNGYCTATAFCSVCSRELTERAESGLTAVKAKCETDGENKWTATFGSIGFTMQTVTETVKALGHNYVATVVAPTCTEKGYTKHACSRCDKNYTDTPVDAIGHKWGEPAFQFAEDGKSAKAERVCENDKSHSEKADATVTVEGTTPTSCKSAGTTTYKAEASFDGKSYSDTKTVEDVPALKHTPGDPVEENRREASCTESGSYDSVVYCTVCETEISRETVEIPVTAHKYGEVSYVWDEETYASCTASRSCTECPASEEETAESSSEVIKKANCTETGEIQYTVSFENEAFETQTKSVETPIAHSFGQGKNDVIYTWAEDYSSCTASGKCTSCEQDVEETVQAEAEVVREASCAEPGETTYTAAFHEQNETLEDQTLTVETTVPHTLGEASYTWDEEHVSCTASAVCSECGETVEETAEASSEETKGASCTENGEIQYTASFENEAFEEQQETVQTDMTPHEYGDPEYQWAEDHSSCTARVSCTVCSYILEETVETSSEETAEASCTENGEILYTASFENEAFEEQQETVQTDMTPHSYGDVNYAWEEDYSSCTASMMCADCEDIVTETVEVTSAQTKDPSCTENGSIQYTAAFENEAFGTRTVTVDLPMSPHKYGEASYVWAADHTSCTASHTCSECGEAESEQGTMSTETTASCDESGVKTYTASFKGTGFSTQTATAEAGPLGHDYQTPQYVWGGDHSSCTATAVCSRDSSHTVTEVATGEQITRETLSTGDIKITARFTNQLFTEQSVTVKEAVGGDGN